MPASPIDRWRVLSRRNTKRYGNHDRRRRVELILGRSRNDPQNSGTPGRIHALVRITGYSELIVWRDCNLRIADHSFRILSWHMYELPAPPPRQPSGGGLANINATAASLD